MKEEISICTKQGNGKLAVCFIKKLTVKSNEEKTKLYARYLRTDYEVHGNIYHQYIVVTKPPKRSETDDQDIKTLQTRTGSKEAQQSD